MGIFSAMVGSSEVHIILGIRVETSLLDSSLGVADSRAVEQNIKLIAVNPHVESKRKVV